MSCFDCCLPSTGAAQESWFHRHGGKVLGVTGVVALAAIAVSSLTLGGVPVLAGLGLLAAKRILVGASYLLLVVAFCALNRYAPKWCERNSDTVCWLGFFLILAGIGVCIAIPCIGHAIGTRGPIWVA